MPSPLVVQTRSDNICTCLALATGPLDDLSDIFGTPFLPAISSTILSLITVVKYLMRNRTLHKIHTFAEAQRDGNTFKRFFRQSEMNHLLKDCKQMLQEALDMLKGNINIHLFQDIKDMQAVIQSQHEELLELIARLSDGTISEQVSSIMGNFKDSSNSLALLPAKPKIFHGRESELQHIANACECEPARIAILGAGGIGKTSLARAVLHHPTITPEYECRLFVECESATTSIELAALITVHLGLKPGTDLTQPVVSYLSKGPNCLLVLDNLETCWEPMDSHGNVEEFLSLLAVSALLGLNLVQHP
ncbi:hypothetical protein FB451DRAFT_1455257 [Mycena latifolia]|nr:hypothetical protein FB451DRAFT_1455257 [Mycena latifolia]